MRRLIVDANVLVFAHGAAHPMREPARRIVEAATMRKIRLHASTEAMQEFLFHRLRRSGNREASVAETRDLCAVLTLHPFDEDVLTDSMTLVETTTIRGRDAVHAATALRHGFREIVTADADFAPVPGLEPVSPAEARLV